MKLSPTADAPTEAIVDLVGIVAFEDTLDSPDGPIAAVDRVLDGTLRQTFAEERFKAKIGQATVVQTQGRLPARRVAVVGAGSRIGSRTADARHQSAELARLANVVGARTMMLIPDQTGGGDEASQTKWLEAAAQGVFLGGYRFDKYLDPEKLPQRTLGVASLHTTVPRKTAMAAIDRGLRVAKAIANARDLVNEPAGTLTPIVLTKRVVARSAEAGLHATVLGPDECRARGMGLFLAVAQGSNEEPRFVHLSWRPNHAVTENAATKCVVLVGKGVTFDSGGLSLKTTEGMLGMKSDMAGAAAVLSAICIAAEENLPIEVHALAACTENMPSGAAYKLGDILRSMSGKTIEINNTDAEGRLTLADALTYGLGLRPDVMLDFATLTGACVVALGPHTAGVMTNDEGKRADWLAAAERAGEDMWPLPLPPRLQDQLKSELADFRNTGERWGGALTAGLFLREFVGTTPWIHVDLAGPATAEKEWGCFGKGATGFGVASIAEYLRSLAKGSPRT